MMMMLMMMQKKSIGMIYKKNLSTSLSLIYALGFQIVSGVSSLSNKV